MSHPHQIIIPTQKKHNYNRNKAVVYVRHFEVYVGQSTGQSSKPERPCPQNLVHMHITLTSWKCGSVGIKAS